MADKASMNHIDTQVLTSPDHLAGVAVARCFNPASVTIPIDKVERLAGWQDVETVPRRARERTDGVGQACRGQPDISSRGKPLRRLTAKTARTHGVGS